MLNDSVLLLQRDLKKEGIEASAGDIMEIVLGFWTDWDEKGSPMGYYVKKQIKDTETGEMIDIIGPNYHLESILLKTHPTWLFLLCSLYEEYKQDRKHKQKSSVPQQR